MFEAWTMMAALAEVTRTARLGQLVTCAGYRNPALLAKQAASVDVMSGGRLIFGIGAGWYDEEYQAYGWTYPPARQRLRAAGGDHPDRQGRCGPSRRPRRTGTTPGSTAPSRPQADPAPLPIWVGGGGEKVTLRIAAEHADATNWQVGSRGVRPQVRGPAGPLRGRGPGLRRHRPHPRAGLPPLRHRRRPGALAGRPRRRRPLGRGGPADLRPGQLRRHRRAGRREGPGLRRRRLLASSSSGSATTPTPSPWSASWPTSSRGCTSRR